MANRIRGITIEIGGDTTKLDKALSGTNKNIKDTQSALKDVERLLKMDPGNTTLLEQKQRLLAQSVEATAEKVRTLKEAMAGAGEALERNNAYEKLSNDLVDAQKRAEAAGNALLEMQNKLDKLQQTDGGGSSEQIKEATAEIERLSKVVDDADAEVQTLKQSLTDIDGPRIDQGQYDALQRELIESERAAKDAEKAFEDCASGLDKFNQKAGNVSETAGKISNAFSPVTKTIGALGAAAVATVPATEELRSDLSKLDNNARMAGVGIDSAREAFKNFAVVSDETDSSVEAVSNLLQAGFTESNLQKAVENLSAAYLAFPDTMKIESLADSLQETLATGEATGQFAELLDRLGIGAENFSAGLANCTTEAQKQDYALSTLAHSGLSATYEEWVKNNEELVENKEASIELQESLAELAESVQPIVTKVTELATKFLDWFNSLDDGAKNLIITIGALVFAIGPVAGAIQGISKVLPNAVGLLDKMDLKTAGVVGGLVLLVDLALKVADAWKNMSTLEKAISVLGMLAAAAAVLAIALNAVSGPIGIALVVAGLVGGIAAVLLAVNSANSKAKAATGNEYNTYPAYANGGVIPPNDPYLALVGDNKTEREIIAPESTLRQIYREENGSGGGYRPVSVNAIMQVDGVTFGRLMVPYIDDETARRGVSIVNK
jgi:phage-related minor tail protein